MPLFLLRMLSKPCHDNRIFVKIGGLPDARMPFYSPKLSNKGQYFQYKEQCDPFRILRIKRNSIYSISVLYKIIYYNNIEN